MPEILDQTSGIILAGGKSRRMGRDKAFLDFDGKPLVARVIERMQSICAEVLIVANDVGQYARFGVPVISDVYPGKGSLGGIYSGLHAVQADYAFALACDMPFVNEALVRHLITLAPGFDVVVPRAHDPSAKPLRSRRADRPLAKETDLHPTHAVYSKSCLAAMEERLRIDDLRIISFYDAVRVRVVEPDEVDRFDPKRLSFFNVNTPEDFQFASSLMD